MTKRKEEFLMVIEKDTILFFSGTGNSLQVAKDIGEQLGGVELCSMALLADEQEVEVKAGLLGIVFPVYYACMPMIVEKVVKKLKPGKATYIFAVATNGGSAGAVLKLLDESLRESGAKLSSGFLVSMPGNYIVKYGAFPLKMQQSAFKKEKEKVKKIAAAIQAREVRKPEMSKLLVDRIFTTTMHKQVKEFCIKDKEFWVTESCNACGICEKACPVKNISLSNDKPAWKHKCEQCMACIQWCPKEAIQYGKKTVGRKRYRNPNVKLKDIAGVLENE